MLKLDSIVGVTGLFDEAGRIKSMGIQCALCHSAVDDSFAPGIGRRLDGWPNRDLNVGAIINLAPDLAPFTAAAVVLRLLVSSVAIGFHQLGRPALVWLNEAPTHDRIEAAGSENLPASRPTQPGGYGDEQPGSAGRKTPATVELKAGGVPHAIINWTGTFLASIGESLVLLYRMLGGETVPQKPVHMMPTFRDKKRAVEISHEIQQSISDYLFSVSLIHMQNRIGELPHGFPHNFPAWPLGYSHRVKTLLLEMECRLATG